MFNRYMASESTTLDCDGMLKSTVEPLKGHLDVYNGTLY